MHTVVRESTLLCLGWTPQAGGGGICSGPFAGKSVVGELGIPTKLCKGLGTQCGPRLKKRAGKMLMQKEQNPDIPDRLFTIEACKSTILA